MIDIYLKAATRAALDKKLVAAGLMADNLPLQDVLLDDIGEIEGATGYHMNVRLMFEPTEEQLAALGGITPPATPYRVWA